MKIKVLIQSECELNEHGNELWLDWEEVVELSNKLNAIVKLQNNLAVSTYER